MKAKKLGGGEGSRWIVIRFFYLLNSVLIAFCFSIFLIYLKNLLVKDTLRKLSKGKNYIRTLWKVIQIVIRVYLKTHLEKFIIPNFHYQECHNCITKAKQTKSSIMSILKIITHYFNVNVLKFS